MKDSSHTTQKNNDHDYEEMDNFSTFLLQNRVTYLQNS